MEQMKRKIVKYLNSKDRTRYSKIDFIFEDYISGRLKQLFIEKGFNQIELFYDIRRKKSRESGLTIDSRYKNWIIYLSFWETHYYQGIYKPHSTVEEIDSATEQFQYEDEFTIDKFLDNLCSTLDKNTK